MKHLSSEQISKVVAGAGIAEEDHVRECSACALEVDRVRDVFALFRRSVRDWTDKQDHSDFPMGNATISDARPSRGRRQAVLGWVLTAAVLTTAVAIPVYESSREREMKAQAERDAQLIDDVNEQLSRHAPLAMLPLMQLMSAKESSSMKPGVEDAVRKGELQ
jgi:hypothetical protein